jgi:hypothetical protein
LNAVHEIRGDSTGIHRDVFPAPSKTLTHSPLGAWITVSLSALFPRFSKPVTLFILAVKLDWVGYVFLFATGRISSVCDCGGVVLDQCGTKDPVTKVPLNQQNATTEFEMALNASGRAMWSNFHCDHGPDNIPSVSTTALILYIRAVVTIGIWCYSGALLKGTAGEWIKVGNVALGICPSSLRRLFVPDHHDNWNNTAEIIEVMSCVLKLLD